MALTTSRRWMLLAVVSAALLLITLDNSILYTALPTLTEELGANGTESLWIINAYPLVMAGLLLGAGTLGDRVGHKRMFLIGLVIFGVASLLAAFSPSPIILIAARAVLAVGAAAMMPATLALIRVTFENPRERNLAIAIWGTIAVIGSALGPILSGLLLEAFWWGSVFLINVPVVLLAIVGALVLAPANDADPTKKWDLVSSIQVMVGLVGLVVAIKEFAHLPPSPLVLGVSLVASAIGFTLFARRQHTLAYPLLDFGIFGNARFVAGIIGAGLAMFSIAGVQLVTTQRFQLIEGLSPLEAGLLVATVALGSLPTSVLGGAILHRVGLLPLVTGGLALGAVGTALVATSFQSINPWMLTGLLLLGAGVGAAMAVASTAIIGNVPVRRAGMASSIEEVSYEFGSLTAVAILGSIVAAIYYPVVESEGSLAAQATAYDSAFLLVMIVVAAVLAAGAIATGVLLRNYGPGSQATLHDAH